MNRLKSRNILSKDKISIDFAALNFNKNIPSYNQFLLRIRIKKDHRILKTKTRNSIKTLRHQRKIKKNGISINEIH